MGYIHKLNLFPSVFTPSNLIDNRTKYLPSSDYMKGEFLVKMSNGIDYYGLPKDDSPSPYELRIYDEFRNISGVTQHKELTKVVQQLGRLGAEKVYNKSVYLHAKLVRKTHNSIVIEVRSDLILHEQAW